MARRKRRLTPEEAELWRSVARTMRRTGKERAEPVTAEPPSVEAPAPSPKPPPSKQGPIGPGSPAVPLRRRMDGVGLDLAPDPIVAAAAPPRIDRRRYERLVRGKIEPQARLDLHGMNREAARGALVRFILRAQAEGMRLVLVITGKGRPDLSDAIVPERTGILRHSLPHWLNAPPLTGRVLEMRPAHQRHGGVGAVYLYLRRQT